MEQIKQFFAKDQYAAHSGIELLSVSEGRSVAQMRLAPQHWNGLGSVHGGAIFTLADFAFAAAANSYGTLAVAINAHITIMKAATTGTLRAEAREISKNFKLGTYTVEVTDDQGDLVALFQGMAYRKGDKLQLI
jgi:acyl-CoA thioesterase